MKNFQNIIEANQINQKTLLWCDHCGGYHDRKLSCSWAEYTYWEMVRKALDRVSSY